MSSRVRTRAIATSRSSRTRARGRRGSLTARAVREPRRSSRDEDEDEVEVEVEGGEGRARERNRNRATSTGTEKNSVGVQRRLARRLLDAQGGWVGTPSASAAASGRDVDEASAEDGLIGDAEVVGVIPEAYTRVRWLLGLLILQSTSSVVLSQYEDLIKENIVITLFLTMRGAGGTPGIRARFTSFADWRRVRWRTRASVCERRSQNSFRWDYSSPPRSPRRASRA